MGRRPVDDCRVREKCRSLTANDLAKAGAFEAGHTWLVEWAEGERVVSDALLELEREPDGSLSVRLSYYCVDSRWGVLFNPTEQGEGPASCRPLSCSFPLTTSRCGFGERSWFACAADTGERSSPRRVANVYMPPGDFLFGCARCWNLTYECRRPVRLRGPRLGERVVLRQYDGSRDVREQLRPLYRPTGGMQCISHGLRRSRLVLEGITRQSVSLSALIDEFVHRRFQELAASKREH